MRNLLAGRPSRRRRPTPVEAPAVSGCVMLIRRAVFERIGVLDDDYFYSFEDVDFCLRARAAGFSVLVRAAGAGVPRRRARRSAGDRPRRIYFATRNHLQLAARLEPRAPPRALTAGAIVALNTAYVLTSADAPLLSGLAAVIRGTWHHLVGRYGPDAAA